MKLRIRRATAGLLCAVLLFPQVLAAQAKKEASRPKLVVVLVVDQMRADYVDKFRHQWTGGLKRLIEHGAWFRQAAYPYLGTYTCAGHATISTGAFPATHGMIANVWWDRAANNAVTCTEEPQAQTISYGAPLKVKGGDGPWRLAVPTLADELRAQLGEGSRVVTFSLKARSAIMLAGHRADAATWHDERTGAWLTSSAYSSSPVAFVQRFLKEHPVDADFGRSWSRALRQDAYLFPDAGLGEKPPAEWTSTFPHVLKGPSDKPDAAFYKLWEESPFSDAYLGQMAAAAVDALGLGKGRGTDFLGVSFTALDYVGHDFGPFSQEVQDLLLHLDATMGALLAHLDRVVGPGNYVIALASDHGVAPIPEQMVRDGLDAGWVLDTQVIERIEKTLEPLLGPGRHVARMECTDFHLLPETYQRLQDNPKAMQSVVDAILSVPGVARVLRGETMRERQPSGDLAVRAARLSYFPGRSGELIIIPKPYWVLTRIVGGVPTTRATNHSSSYAYDQRVPVFLMGHGIRPGEYLTAATPADIAPTLAFLCGITLARTDGRVLTEAIAFPAAPPAKPAAPKR